MPLNENASDIPNPSSIVDSSHVPRPHERLRSSFGVVHDKDLCVWCMKGLFKCSDNSKQTLLLSTEDACNKFKVHTVQLEDSEMRSKLNTLIASIPDC